MKKTEIVTFNEKSESVIPKINSLKNKIILNVNQSEEESFRAFLEEEKWDNTVRKFKKKTSILKKSFFINFKIIQKNKCMKFPLFYSKYKKVR